MADRALVIRGVKLAVRITEEGKFAGAAVDHRSGGEFVLRGSAEIIGADNHHAKNVAVELSGDQIGLEQSRGLRGCLWSDSGRRE